ncbi:hypothetical protein Pcinc_006631 [Petrolisthes cinctipes]|uniref:Chitin-binding type-2 domain-containing protein n=1 Tax=Petrolisthes cinctipes TaxID=88211 RepID=A0AAE1GCI7_PETCI|nr:hypothetical protein Pcinc_006631 [Petrolisthes cinctipes]
MTRYKVVRSDVQVGEEHVLQVLQLTSNIQCAMTASVWAARAFATRPREGTVRVSGHCYNDRDIGGACGGEGLEGVYFLHPTDCNKYLVCASGRVVEMWNAEGTALSIRGFVATSDLHGAKCACNGSTLM